MRGAALWVGLVLAVLLLVPVVQSSHTVGHRYLVYGRLLDANGLPIQNQDVTLKILDRGSSIASIVTRTDCLGDFENWEGQPGTDPPGGGKIEQNQNAQYGRYIAFHFHDPELSDQYDVQVVLGGESKTLEFHSRDRQTSVREQFAAAYPMACDSYDSFNQTFSFRISALNEQELSYTTDVSPAPRSIVATLGGATANGTADFNGAFASAFHNLTVSEGDVLQMDVQDVGARTHTVTAEDVKYRRFDASYRIGEGVGGALNVLKFLGIGAAVILVAGALYVGANKMRDKMAERRLRETSTRRRFRREKEE